MRPRAPILLVSIAFTALGFGGIALSNPSWVTAGSSSSESPREASYLTSDPAVGPREQPDGPLSVRLSGAVAAIPELGSLVEEDRLDVVEGTVEAGILGLVASDGSRVDIVVQQLPAPLDVRDVGSPDDTRLVVGPKGENLILRDLGHSLQVVGVDSSGLAVNIIVERINRQNPGSPTILDDIDLERIQGWVIDLLSEVSPEGSMSQ